MDEWKVAVDYSITTSNAKQTLALFKNIYDTQLLWFVKKVLASPDSNWTKAFDYIVNSGYKADHVSFRFSMTIPEFLMIDKLYSDTSLMYNQCKNSNGTPLHKYMYVHLLHQHNQLTPEKIVNMGTILTDVIFHLDSTTNLPFELRSSMMQFLPLAPYEHVKEYLKKCTDEYKKILPIPTGWVYDASLRAYLNFMGYVPDELIQNIALECRHCARIIISGITLENKFDVDSIDHKYYPCLVQKGIIPTKVSFIEAVDMAKGNIKGIVAIRQRFGNDKIKIDPQKYLYLEKILPFSRAIVQMIFEYSV